MDFKELLSILGMANESEYITVQQLASATGYSENTVRKRLKWGIENQKLSGSLDGDMFVRRHKMRELHIEYTYWLEHPEEYPWDP